MTEYILVAGDSICVYEGENMKSKEFLFSDNYKIKKIMFTQDKRQVFMFQKSILISMYPMHLKIHLYCYFFLNLFSYKIIIIIMIFYYKIPFSYFRF